MLSELELTMARGRAAGVTQRVASVIERDGRTVRLDPDGHPVVSFATCSYLGLDRDDRLAQGAIDAVLRCGVSFSASRCFVTSPLYGEAEELLARIFDRPVVLAGSTTLAHGAALPILVDRSDVVLFDRQVHHSVQTALAALGPRGPRREPVKHADIDALEDGVRRAIEAGARRVWYCADGIYSMFGDRLPTAALAALMQRYDALWAYLDDAHGMSWCGSRGAGSLIDAGLPRERTVLATSLSKGFGCAGGVLAVPDIATKHRIENLGPSLMFSIQIPPPILGAIRASAQLHLAPELAQLQAELAERVVLARAAIAAVPAVAARLVETTGEPTPILYVVLGTADQAIAAASQLLASGFLVNPVAFPAVPMNMGGLRCTITRSHTAQDLHDLVSAIERVVTTVSGETRPSSSCR
ncbi:MAG TPA: aminotransferase class I/II-fold pyridoxal phosphate-dependent enzyme [Kofleriaceae bacterium]|nr:aminotransferase class I/II-fold pyridoxal phosphate-dependent enzyme [Kofleriaceae bacterium]